VEVDMHPTTTRNLLRALEREAVAAARMTAYARSADQDGDPDAARTLRAIARFDLDHAADMAEHLGWVGNLHENVLASVIGDATTQGLDYATLAGEAQRAGDDAAAELFRRLTADETEAAIGLLALATRNVPRTPDVDAHRAAAEPANQHERRLITRSGARPVRVPAEAA
jgi:rubrerythrin